MPGLVPGIDVFETCCSQDVDGRDKPGHDELRRVAKQNVPDLVGEQLPASGHQHPFRIVAIRNSARHAVIEQGLRAAHPVAAADRLVAGGP
ncbi:DUF6894 family protein [Bradyrhizobium sp. BR 1433]|uniref:DUF6894 family protein n=1 Tax=Bradyrhizobium sp. BR 1433 TaxID=3447967 RepID=UPI003EE7BC44